MTIEVLGADQARCTKFKLTMPVTLGMDDAGSAPGDFVMTAYTGQVIDRWWGRLAIDMTGITAAAKMPILREHARDRIVGHSAKSWLDGSFFVSGTFSKITEDAKEVRGLAEEGFPWQASVGISAKKVKVLSEGEEMDVNGETLSGPADVWLESEVFETSFVSLGADDRTTVAVFSAFDDEHSSCVTEPTPDNGEANNKKRSELMEFTIENLKAKAPDLLKQIQDDAHAAGLAEGLSQGAEKERARIQGVKNACLTGHEALIETLMWDGKSTEAEAAMAIVQAEKKVRSDKKSDLAADGIAPVATVDPPVPGENRAPRTADEFSADTALMEEFGSFDAYKAYMDAVGSGLVKTLKKEVK